MCNSNIEIYISLPEVNVLYLYAKANIHIEKALDEPIFLERKVEAGNQDEGCPNSKQLRLDSLHSELKLTLYHKYDLNRMVLIKKKIN